MTHNLEVALVLNIFCSKYFRILLDAMLDAMLDAFLLTDFNFARLNWPKNFGNGFWRTSFAICVTMYVSEPSHCEASACTFCVFVHGTSGAQMLHLVHSWWLCQSCILAFHWLIDPLMWQILVLREAAQSSAFNFEFKGSAMTKSCAKRLAWVTVFHVSISHLIWAFPRIPSVPYMMQFNTPFEQLKHVFMNVYEKCSKSILLATFLNDCIWWTFQQPQFPHLDVFRSQLKALLCCALPFFAESLGFRNVSIWLHKKGKHFDGHCGSITAALLQQKSDVFG